MLLRRTAGKGAAGKAEFTKRLRQYERGEFTALLCEQDAPRQGSRRERDVAARAEEANNLVGMGLVSRARQALVSADLAPGTQATLDQLRDPERRPCQQQAAIPEAVMNFQPQQAVELDRGMFLSNLRAAARGAAGTLNGARDERHKVFLG